MKTAINSGILRTTSLLLIVVSFCPLAHGKVLHMDDEEKFSE